MAPANTATARRHKGSGTKRARGSVLKAWVGAVRVSGDEGCGQGRACGVGPACGAGLGGSLEDVGACAPHLCPPLLRAERAPAARCPGRGRRGPARRRPATAPRTRPPPQAVTAAATRGAAQQPAALARRLRPRKGAQRPRCRAGGLLGAAARWARPAPQSPFAAALYKISRHLRFFLVPFRPVSPAGRCRSGVPAGLPVAVGCHQTSSIVHEMWATCTRCHGVGCQKKRGVNITQEQERG
jgi:hypothetical protein